MKPEIPFEYFSRANARALLAAFALASIMFLPSTASAQRSVSELETLVAPIALYPDPLLAQLLPASTYPDQIAAAAEYVAKNGTNGVEAQGWDASVAATARHKEAIGLMGSEPAWTADLGTAFLDQTSGVMDAIQQMRSRARASGALQDTPQQKVVLQEEVIRIVPAEPEVIYVPEYDTQVVYVESDSEDWDDAFVAGAIGFGVGIAMGVWLDMDCDWWGHSMFYHGWHGGGNYWSGGHYASFTRNTNINVDRPVWNNPGRPGGAGNRPGNRPGNGAGNRPGNRPGDRPGNLPSNRPGDRPGNRPDNRPADRPGARPGTLPAGSGAADRARPSTQPSTKLDQDVAKKRERAQKEMRGKMPATSDRRGASDAGRRDDGARADRDRAKGSDRKGGAFDQYQRGSDARRSSDRGASSQKRSSMDRGGSRGGGRSSAPRGGGGGGRRGGGRRG